MNTIATTNKSNCGIFCTESKSYYSTPKYTENWYLRLPPTSFSLARRAIETYGIQSIETYIIQMEVVFCIACVAFWSGPPSRYSNVVSIVIYLAKLL